MHTCHEENKIYTCADSDGEDLDYDCFAHDDDDAEGVDDAARDDVHDVRGDDHDVKTLESKVRTGGSQTCERKIGT